MSKIDTNDNEKSNFHLPCGSPFNNLRPMTPLENLQFMINQVEHMLGSFSNLIKSNIMINIMCNSEIELTHNIHQWCDEYLSSQAVNHTDEQLEFKSISQSNVTNMIEHKEETTLENNKVINKEIEDNNDDDEISKTNSNSDNDSNVESESESASPTIINSETLSQPNIESITNTISDSNIEVKSETIPQPKNDHKNNTNLLFGEITSLNKNKSIITLADNRKGSFPDKFNYYGNTGDKVRVSIKYENKEKNKLILNLINKEYKIGDIVNGTININNDNTYVNVQGIKLSKFPTKYKNKDLKNGMKVSCSIYEIYDYLDPDGNISGLLAILTFESIMS